MLPYRHRIHHLPNSCGRRTRMRRFALVLLAGAALLVAAPLHPLAGQGFGVYEHNTCAMGRGGVTAARPCADGSAIYFSPAGLAGLSGTHVSVGVTLIGALGNFTDDFLASNSDLKNPLIPVPNIYITHAINPKLTAGIGLYAPYGLQTKWDPNTFSGRFLGYNTDIRSIYIQPTIGYQLSPKLKFGIGVAYITSHLKLRQRADLSTVPIPPTLAGLFPTPPPAGTTFGMLGVPTGTDFADALLDATGSGFAANFGAIWQVTDRLSIGGHWLTRNKINDAWSFMADYQYTVWGWFSDVNIDFANPATPDLALHPSNKDTHGFRFGTEYQYNSKVQLRGGYLYHTAASPAQFVTPLLPEAPRNEFTVGAGIALTPRWHADLAYQFIKQNDRRGTVNPAQGNTGVYQFSAHLFGAGLAITF